MSVTCPKCFSEDAFFNGVCYECPDCDYEWGGVDFDESDDLDEDWPFLIAVDTNRTTAII